MVSALFTPIDMTEYEDAFCGEYYSTKPIPHCSATSFNGEIEPTDIPDEISEPIIEDADPPSLGLNDDAEDRRQARFADPEDDDDDEEDEDGEEGGDEDDDEEEEETEDPNKDPYLSEEMY